MKRIYFVMLMLSVCIGSYAQKVKVKKNIISVDKVEVGITEKYKNDETKENGYTYSDMKGENKFTMVRYYLDEKNVFFIVRPDFTKDTAEIKMEYLYFTFNEQNALTDLLVKRYRFFDKDGMNTNAVKEYLAAGHEPQIPKIREQIRELKLAEEKTKQDEENKRQVIKNMNIGVSQKNILNGKYQIRMGGDETSDFFISEREPTAAISTNNPIIIKDGQHNTIAEITAINDHDATVVTYDKHTFAYKTKNRYDKTFPSSYYQEIAEFLAMKEYLKGQPNYYLIKKVEYDRMQREAEQRQKEAEEARKAEYKKRTEVEGILTLKDGTIIEGLFKFAYRQTLEGGVSGTQGLIDLDAGKSLFHLYKNEKGKNKSKKYGVKEISTFYIGDKSLSIQKYMPYLGDNEMYESVTYKKINRLKKAMQEGELNIGTLLGSGKSHKLLLRILYRDKIRLYFYGGEYILMKPDSEDAVTGETLDTDDLAEFLSDCPEVSQKIKNNKYANNDYGYKQMVVDYTECFDASDK